MRRLRWLGWIGCWALWGALPAGADGPARSAPAPVVVEGQVTTVNWKSRFFLQCGDRAYDVLASPSDPRVAVGQWLRVAGRLLPGKYAPALAPERIEILGVRPLLPGRTVGYPELEAGTLEGQWVTVRGVIRAVQYDRHQNALACRVGLRAGVLRVFVNPPLPLDDLLRADAEVEFHGVAAGSYNAQGQLLEAAVRVPGAEFVTVIQPAPQDPFRGAPVAISDLMRDSLGPGLQEHRMLVAGTVVRQFSRTELYLSDRSQGLRVRAVPSASLAPGDEILAAGFPGMIDGLATLDHAVLKRQHGGVAPAPAHPTPGDALAGTFNLRLVTIRAILVAVREDGGHDALTFRWAGRDFAGEIRPGVADLAALPRPGSLVDLTGICLNNDVDAKLHGQQRSFSLAVAGAADVVTIRPPNWWTRERLVWALMAVLAGLAAAGGWVLLLRAQVARKRRVIELQSARTATLEERNRIARDLHDTLEQALTGLSLVLKSAADELARAPDAAADRLESGREMLRQSRALARQVIGELRSDPGDPAANDLLGSLRRATEHWNRTGASRVELRICGEPRPLRLVETKNLVGIGTEALTNAVKHGRARAISVAIRFDAERVELAIEDDGVGFDPLGQSPLPRHYGLLGMRERARQANGQFEIQSAPGRGTRVTVAVASPISRDAR